MPTTTHTARLCAPVASSSALAVALSRALWVPATAALAVTFTAAALTVPVVAGRALGLSGRDGAARSADASLLFGGP